LKFFDKTGQPVDVPDDQAQAAFQSGDFGLPKGATLPVVGSDGTVGHVDAEHANDVFDAGGRLAAPEEIHKAEAEAKYGGIGGMAAAGGESFARGLTLGLSDPLAIGAAGISGGAHGEEEMRAHLAGTKEANPITSGVGEVAGVIAPSLVTGGAAAGVEGVNAARLAGEGVAAVREASTLGRVTEGAKAALSVAGKPVSMVSEAGALAERGVKGLLGEGATSLAGKMAQTIAKKGTQGAVEGALFSVANEVDESVLGDTELTGEKLLAAAGHGALLGGTLGGVLGGAGELGSSVLGKLSPKLQGVAEEQAFRSVNARKAFTARAADIPGGSKALGRVLLDNDLIRVGDTLETIAPRLAAAKESAVDELTKVVSTVETKGVPLADTLNALEKRASEFDRKLGYESAANAVRQQRENLARVFGAVGEDGKIVQALVDHTSVPLGDLLAARRSLEGTINWQTDTVVAQGRKAAGRTLEDIVTEHGEQAAKASGSTFKDAYATAKLRFRQLSLLDEAAQDSLNRANANAAHSLTDKIFGAAGFAAGATHGPLGAVGGLAMGQASKFVRERGNAASAVLLDKLSALSGVERAAQKVDRQVDRGVAGFFKPGERAAIKLKPKYEATETDKSGGPYRSRVESVARAVANADHHADAAAAATADIQNHAPQTANAFQRAALRTTAYLQSQIPQGHRDLQTITPQFGQPRVSDAEKARFNRVMDVTHDPPRLLEHMARGVLTLDEVKAVKHTSPSLYKEMVTKVQHELSVLKKPLSYDQRKQLAVFLGQPTDATLAPAFIASMQKNFSTPTEKPQQTPGMPQAPKRMLSDSLSTSTALSGQSRQ